MGFAKNEAIVSAAVKLGGKMVAKKWYNMGRYIPHRSAEAC